MTRMTDPGKPSLNLDLNILDDRADELISKYVTGPVNDYVNNHKSLRPGQIYKKVIEDDSLLTNEKAYIIAFMAQEITCFIARRFLITDPDRFGQMLHVNISGVRINDRDVKKP